MDLLKLHFPRIGGGEISHTYMDGGAIFVPADKHNSFNEMYIEEIKSGKTTTLVERCNHEEFRFFTDFDIKLQDTVDLATVQKLAKQAREILDIGNCIVLVGNPKKVDDLMKSGIHMVWYDSKVNLDRALEYRKKLMEKLDFPGWDFGKFIDASVYKSGLRLPWAAKFVNGKYEDPYLPYCVVQKGGRIRVLDPTPDVKVLKMASFRIPTAMKRTKSAGQIVEHPEALEKMQKFIRTHFPNHEDAFVTGLSRKDKFLIISTNSKFCLARRAPHTNNHVYFVVDDKFMIYQKCHNSSECNNSKTSDKYNIPTHLKKLLRTILFVDNK